MLRISVLESAVQAQRYFVDAPSLEAYYTGGQEFVGFWGGKGAERLGLEGPVAREAFIRLTENLHPKTGEKLTVRMMANRRVGWDWNFNVPKSVTLAYMYSKDERILQAVRQAEWDTLLDMQEHAATRVRGGSANRDDDRLTGELVWAEFFHLTARPEDGVPDPHVHSHVVVFNMTFDPVESRWKALQTGDIHEDADRYNGAFMVRLANNLKGLGLEIESGEKSFEIAGFARELNLKFSRRTKKINATAERLGITDPVEKAKLAALTRERKVKSLLIPELEPIWWERLTPEEREVLEGVKSVLQRSREAEVRAKEPAMGIAYAERSSEAMGEQPKPGKNGRISLNRATRPVPSPKVVAEPTEHDRRAVTMAAQHLLERNSVVTPQQLECDAFKSWCLGKATVEGIRAAILEAPLERLEQNGRTLLTTQAILDEENRIIARGIAGRHRHQAINEGWGIKDKKLNAEQQAAVLHVLNSDDFITGIAGQPGTGKTRLLREIRRGIEAGGQKMKVLAAYAVTANETLRKDGFGNAQTLARLLQNTAVQEEARGAVWVVDEAGLVSTPLADKLLATAEKLDARLVFVGDMGQHHPVERGQAFDLLMKYQGMEVATVEEIQRQHGTYKRAVEHFAKGDTTAGFQLMDVMGSLVEAPLEERGKLLAAAYVATVKKGKSALVVAPTHAECEDVTQAIRQTLKKKKILGESVEWQILRNLSWTQAQKNDAEHYEPGMVVQINRQVRGFSLGERLEVIAVRDGEVWGRSTDGEHSEMRTVPLYAADSFAVYERDAIEVCVGDQVRITGNGRSAEGRRLNNGSCYAVESIDRDGRLVLENGMRLEHDFAHLNYGYAVTSHAAQGKTVDYVYVAQAPEMSAAASDLQQILVSISRGRKGAKIYTTDIERLREDVSRLRERPMATELTAEKQAPQETTRQARTTARRQCRAKEPEAAREPEVPCAPLLGQLQPETWPDYAQPQRRRKAMERGLEMEMGM